MDALGDELEFEDEDIPSYLQEDEVDLPKAAETDPKQVTCSLYLLCSFFILIFFLKIQHHDVKLDEFGLPVAAETPMKA